MHVDFTITLQGIGTILAIASTGLGIIHWLRKISEKIGEVHSQHRVLWYWFSKDHPDRVPPEMRPKDAD